MRPLRRPPPPATLQSVQVAAPVGGLNTLSSMGAMPDGDCVQLFNLVAGDKGLRTRLGYRHWGGAGDSVRSMLPYAGSSSDGSRDRLFAVDKLGIWNDTNATALSAVAWSSTRTLAGYGSCHAFSTAAGGFLVYCDEEFGYLLYSESSDSWTQITLGGGALQVSGVDPANLCFVTVWKSRLWFVEKNSSNVWYLAAGAVTGAATKLDLDRSAQFRNGGGVRCLANWTLDGGIGIDDYLVAVGDGGDVAVYQGTDPASASTFSLRGTWYAGGLVAGRHVTSTLGGDVLLLTKAGVRTLSQLVSGGDGQQTYLTAKIANLFNRLTLERGDLQGWGIFIHPEENALIINVPDYPSGGYTTPTAQQLVQSLWNRSWSRFRGLPMTTACVWRGKLYFGGTDAVIYINDGDVDAWNPNIDPTVFTPVQWQLLTPFRGGGGKQTRVELIRPSFLSNQASPDWSAQARYNFDLSELSDVSLSSASGSNSWGVGTWDGAAWVGDDIASRRVVAATGIGTDVAISLRGASISRTTIVGIDVFLSQGGYL